MTTMLAPDLHQDVDRLYDEASARWRAHRTEDATALLQRALELDEDDARCLSLYGVCLASRGLEFKRALGCCRRAIRKEPNNVAYQLHIAKVYKYMGDQASAYKVLLRTWRTHPTDAQAAAELARMGVRQPAPLPFLPRSHYCNRFLGRWRTRLRAQWLRLLATQKMAKAGHEA